MWIQTQNKQRIINSDQIIDIFVDRTGTKIMAETTRDGDFFNLGEYKDRDTCLDILEHIGTVIGSNTLTITMPLGGAIDEWKNGIIEIAAHYIIKNLK